MSRSSPSLLHRCLLACVVLGAVIPVDAMAQPAVKPTRGGTLVYPVHMGEPSTLDCHAGNQSLAFRVSPHYSSLLKIDVDNYPEVRGDLARSWKVSPDGLAYTFNLHPSVKFHDGSRMTAADVKASYDRMRAPPTGVVSLRKAMFEDIASIETPDASTVVIRLKEANAAMLKLLAMPYACVYSAKLMASDPSYPSKRVMGTGPFKMIRYAAGSEWVGERFDGYFKPNQPYIDGFRALSTSGAATTNAVLSGQVHYNVRGLTQSEVERVRASRGSKVRIVGGETSTGLLQVISVNTRRPPLDDARVRRALTLAIDRRTGSSTMERFTAIHLWGGLSRPGSGYARSPAELESLPGFGRDIEASRREAKRLLAEAGQTNLKINFVNRTQSPYWGVYIVDQLRQIGVTVEHQMNETPQVAARKASGDYDLMIDALPEYLDDPTVQWSVFKPFKDNPANLTRTDDPKLLELFVAQKRALDPAQRRVRVQEMEKYVIEQAYVLPLFWQSWKRAISNEVGGLDDMPSNFLMQDLADLWLHPARQ